MKIAVCLRGEIRTGVEALPSLLNFIGKLLPHCDFFIHTWDNSWHRPLYKQTEEPLRSSLMFDDHNDRINSIKKLLKPKLIKIENYTQVEQYYYANFYEQNQNIDNWFIARFYSFEQVINLKTMWEYGNNTTYDYVLVTRPDILYNQVNLSDLLPQILDNTFGVNGVFLDMNNDPCVIDDHFFLARSHVMNNIKNYSTYKAFHAAEEYKLSIVNSAVVLHKPFYHFIKKHGYDIVDLQMKDFSDKICVYRKECFDFDPLTEFLKCEACDKLLYHNFTDRLSRFTDDEQVALFNRVLETRNYVVDVLQKINLQNTRWKLYRDRLT